MTEPAQHYLDMLDRVCERLRFARETLTEHASCAGCRWCETFAGLVELIDMTVEEDFYKLGLVDFYGRPVAAPDRRRPRRSPWSITKGRRIDR